MGAEKGSGPDRITVSGIELEWDVERGACTFQNLPVAMMWVDSTLAGLMSGLQTMVGEKRFALALQAEGRKSVEEDWKVISAFPDFREGFRAIANIAAVAGWGRWVLTEFDEGNRKCRFRAIGGWEGRCQQSRGTCWGSAMLAGKFAGYCSRLFGANCWAEQTAFIAKGDPHDEFEVTPSSRSVENEIENLLAADGATRADMAVALRRLEAEIAERRRAEEALRQNQEFLAALLDTSQDWIWVADRRGLHTYSNPAIETILGYPAREIAGRAVFDLLSEEDRSRAEAINREAVKERRGWKNQVLRWRRRDGGVRYLESSSVPLFDAAGDVAGFRGVDRDITERREAETQRLEVERRLLHAQKLESLGVLAGGMAHDFNNLLMVINGYSDLLLAGLGPHDTGRSHVELIRQAGEQAAGLISQLLAFGRKQVVQPRSLSLNAVVSSAEKMLRRVLRENIELVTILDPSLGLVMADPGQMHQVLMNLAVNARDALPAGGRLTIRTSNIYVDETYAAAVPDAAAGHFALLAVTDNGVGMDSETQRRLFEPFFTTKEPGRGTGLGLSTVYGIVRQSGGWVCASSELGKGSTFEVYLPLTDVEEHTEPPPESVRPLRGSETVLVVEDDEEVRILVTGILSGCGYSILSAPNGAEALKLATAKGACVDLLLTDVVMPGMSGSELAQLLKNFHPQVKVLYMSGYTEERVGQGHTVSGGACLAKPFSPAALTSKVREVLAAG